MPVEKSTARQTLKGKVLTFWGKSLITALRDLLIEAVRYGNDPG